MSRAILWLLILLLPLSLVGCRGQERITNLDYQSYPLYTRGTLAFDEHTYEVLVAVERAGDLKLQILSPERIAGVVFELTGGEAHVCFDNIRAPLGSNAYIAKEGVLLAAELFSLSAKGYDGAGVTTEEGVRYSYAHYITQNGRATVYFTDGSSLPHHITATLNGHTFSFLFVNES